MGPDPQFDDGGPQESRPLHDRAAYRGHRLSRRPGKLNRDVRRVAAVSGGPAYPIYAPLVVDTPDTAGAIRRQPQVAEAFRLFDTLTKAVVAIGSWDPPDSQLRDGVDEFEREAMRSLGVRAEICSTLVADSGHAVAAELTVRSIAISGDQLRRIPEVIAVAGGLAKATAVRAVLTGGYITSLVTDASVARVLLDSVPDLQREPRAVSSSPRP
jgi:DNA-binding transcriptional regulator LsrR (DeoR family)